MKAGVGWWLEEIARVPLLTPEEEIELGHMVQAWLNHPDGADNAPAKVKRLGKKAKDRFVTANLRLCVSYVSKKCSRIIKSRAASQEDLIQAANMGLIRAVEKFDPRLGYRFSTYAYWWIRQSTNRYLDASSRIITIPSSHTQIMGKLDPARRELTELLKRPPTEEELAGEMGISVEMLRKVKVRAQAPLSLNWLTDEEGSELGDIVGEHDPQMARWEEEHDQNADIQRLTGLLTPQQKRVVEMRYGFISPAKTIGDIAKIERVSHRTVGNILRSALNVMSRAQQGFPPFHQHHVGRTTFEAFQQCDQLCLDLGDLAHGSNSEPLDKPRDE